MHLQNFNLHLATLSVDLYGLTSRRSRPAPQSAAAPGAARPGRRARRLRLRREVVLRQHSHRQPRRTDLRRQERRLEPSRRSRAVNSSSNTSVFDLGIRHAVLTNGAVFYNNQPSAIALDLRDVEFNAALTACLQKYSGTLHTPMASSTTPARRHRRTRSTCNSMPRRQRFHLSPAKIQSGNIQLVLTATVNNYSAPVVQAQYNATVDGPQLASASAQSIHSCRTRRCLRHCAISIDRKPPTSAKPHRQWRSHQPPARRENSRHSARKSPTSLLTTPSPTAMRPCATSAPAFSAAKSRRRAR